MELINTDVRLKKIAFVGAGNMARSIITGLLAAGFKPENILACAPTEKTRKAISQQLKIHVSSDNSDSLNFADVIVIAVKPNLVETVVKEINSTLKSTLESEVKPDAKADINRKLFISVAAGVSIAKLQSYFESDCKVVAAMPNLPCSVRQGVTGLVAAANCEQSDQQLINAIFSEIGEAVWLDDETQMAPLVAAAGSSPAYFFLFLEAMIESAKKMGLSQQQAEKSVLQSGLGALTMAFNSDQNVAELRDQVTSPNGTTHQAIQSFLENDISLVVDQAMQAAANKVSNY